MRVQRTARRRPLWADQRGGAPRLRLILLLLPVAFASWLVLPVPALIAFVPPPDRPPAQPGLPWLSSASGRIVDTSGRTVMLHGFDDEALLEADVDPAPLTVSDAEIIESAGFDVVRLPIAWSKLEPQRGHFSAAYLDQIASTVAMLNAHRLYVVLDMHFLAWSAVYGGSGAPAWATLGWVPDIYFGAKTAITVPRLLSPAINASETYFWLTNDWQDQLLATWRFVVHRFHNDSGIAGYDIFNEGHAFPLPPLRFDKDQLFPFYARAIAAMGEVDPNHLFFLENDALDDLPTAVVPISAPDLVYSPHIYTGVLSPALSAEPGALDTRVGEVAKEAGQLSAPMWVGEFGLGGGTPDAVQWITDSLDAFNAHDAGWAWWQWRGGSLPAWAIRSRDGSRLNMTFLRLLAQPYLAAAPPGVTASGSDGVSGRLDISVAARHGAGTIVVGWSAFTLGTPTVRSNCAATTSWDAAIARLAVAVPEGVSCALQLGAA